jgi:NAD(P)-dependent dehydrogenase (short-subunit alcohol dehydrogenase family)
MSALRQLDGRVAIVTGATAGIGPAICERLARAGAAVVLLGRDRARVDAAAASVRRVGTGHALGITGDVRVEADMAHMAEDALQHFGQIDILIAAAGILRAPGARPLQTLSQMTSAEWDAVIDTNLTGVFLADRAVLPAMIRQGEGHIINVSSTSGRKAYAFDTAYCASKYGVLGLTEALAAEVARHGVLVEALLPGAIDTPMWEQNGPLQRPEHALPPARVADLVLTMLTLPGAVLPGPAIEPLGLPARTGWLGSPQ